MKRYLTAYEIGESYQGLLDKTIAKIRDSQAFKEWKEIQKEKRKDRRVYGLVEKLDRKDRW